MSVSPNARMHTGDDLSAMVSSRICHDLINPMGAISNGLELLEAVGKNLGPELELVADSVANATARLNYFRIAFGQAEENAELRTALLQKTISEMFTSRRFAPEVSTRSVSVPRRSARTMLLVLLCVESAVPLGGTLFVREEENGGWSVRASGKRIQINAPLWEGLVARIPHSQTLAGEVHFAAASAALRDYGLSLMFEAAEEELRLELMENSLAEAV